MDKELETPNSNTKEAQGRWTKGHITQENYKDVCVCRDGVMKVKFHLELNLAKECKNK